MKSVNYYRILGVNKKSTQSDISKAYKKLALRFHPDKNTSTDASNIFKEISEAYDFLSSSEKRQVLDLQLSEIENEPMNKYLGVVRKYIQLSLSDVYHLGNSEITIKRTTLCPNCHGLIYDSKNCHVCRGSCLTDEYVTFNVNLRELFHSEKMEKTYPFEGNYNVDEGFRYDLIIIITLDMMEFTETKKISHKVRTDKYDLLLTLPISLAEALCGFSRTITLLTGEKLEYTSFNTLKDGDLYVISNEGLPHYDGSKGNIYIYIEVMSMPPLPPNIKRCLWESLTQTPYIERKFTFQPKISRL